MVIGLDDDVVVCNQHFIAPHEGTDGRTRWQIDFADGPADDFGIAFAAVRNSLDCLRSTTAQAVHHGHITAADVAEERRGGGLLR